MTSCLDCARSNTNRCWRADLPARFPNHGMVAASARASAAPAVPAGTCAALSVPTVLPDGYAVPDSWLPASAAPVDVLATADRLDRWAASTNMGGWPGCAVLADRAWAFAALLRTAAEEAAKRSR